MSQKNAKLRLLAFVLASVLLGGGVMGYNINIQRIGDNGEICNDEGKLLNPIPTDEWKQAISETEGLRLRELKDHVGRNPKTGETIRIKGSDGEVEIFDEDDWYTAIWWRDGSATFRPTDLWFEEESYFRDLIFILADKLNAKVLGDDGEEYNRNGSVVGAEQASSSKPWWKFW